MDTQKLDIVNIAVIAPTGAGKTALISTVCDYIRESKATNKAKGYNFDIHDIVAEDAADFATALDGKLAAKNLDFNSALIPGSRECAEYTFSIKFTDKNTGFTIEQPFCVLDIPGAFINNPDSYKNNAQYDKFINHLDNSRILWIPIDAPVLMECNTDTQKGYSRVLRRRDNLKRFAKEWAEFAAENNVTDYCNFVLVKCESYFSKDTSGQYNFCKNRFDEEYKSVVDTIRSVNQEDKIACVAVETIGAVRVNTSGWSGGNLSVKYVVEETDRHIRGAEYLLKDVLKVAKANVETEVEKRKALKVSQAQGLKTDLQRIIADKQAKIRRMKEQESSLSYKIDQLDTAKHDRNNKGLWDTIRNWWDGNIDELDAKIRNLDSHIKSIRTTIAEEQRKLSELQSSQSTTESELDDVQQEIIGLNKLGELFDTLSVNSSSPYYRPL
jgi:hypothetical protein